VIEGPIEGDDERARQRRRAIVRELDPEPSRRRSVLVGAGVLLVIGLIVFRGPRRVPEPTSSMPVPPVVTATESGHDKLTKAMAELEAVPITESSATRKLFEALEDVGPSNVGRKMMDGTEPPPLPADAPKRVRFGVVLVRYRGAQLAPFDAPTREASAERARLLAKLAKNDFAEAVREGDDGSYVDIGTVKRGVLEAGIEYTLFTLPKGAVSDVLDTPRGFWIVRRIR